MSPPATSAARGRAEHDAMPLPALKAQERAEASGETLARQHGHRFASRLRPLAPGVLSPPQLVVSALPLWATAHRGASHRITALATRAGSCPPATPLGTDAWYETCHCSGSPVQQSSTATARQGILLSLFKKGKAMRVWPGNSSPLGTTWDGTHSTGLRGEVVIPSHDA
jgi:hypothetical protein